MLPFRLRGALAGMSQHFIWRGRFAGLSPLIRKVAFSQQQHRGSCSAFGEQGRTASWIFLEGKGKEAPKGGGLQTDDYMALRNTSHDILLQLYYGSTGAVMFKGGGKRRSRIRWLGWDGDFKEGKEGGINFSSFLAPELMERIQKGEGRHLSWKDVREAGYWRLAPGKERDLGGACFEVTNVKSNVRLVLTQEGFVFESDKGDTLVIVSREEDAVVNKKDIVDAMPACSP